MTVAATNIGVSLYYSGGWQHARSYERQTVIASWGAPDEGSGITPAECKAQLDNRDSDELTRPYSPGDARSSLYGLIGRNTPGRVALAAGLDSGAMSDTQDAFGRTSVNGWGATDTGEAWSLSGSGGTVSTANWQVGSGVGTMNVPAADAYRYSYLADVSVRDVNIAVTFRAPQATGASLYPANILIRGDSDFGWVRGRVELTTANAVKVLVVARDQVTVLGEATVAGLTHAGTGTPLRVRLFAAGTRIQMRVWAAAGAEPDTWALTVTDTTEVPQTGRIGVRSGRALGNTNSTNPQFSYDDWESTTYLPIADGAVSSWAPDRAVVADAWTDIAITGPAQRINASETVISAIRSSLNAELSANNQSEPEGYWPLEDGANTLTTESRVDRTPGMAVYQAVSTITAGIVKFGEGTAPPGSLPVIDLSGGGSLRVILPDNDSFSDIWSLDWVATFPLNGADGSVPGSMLTFLTDSPGVGYITTDADSGGWRMFYGPSETAALTGRAVAEAPPGFPAAPIPNPYSDGLPHHYRISAAQNGGDVEITLYYDGFQVAVGKDFSDDGNPTTSIGRITEIRINDANPEGGSFMPSLGQLVLWYSSPSDTYTMAFGYPEESCIDRYVRLLAEHGLSGGVIGEDSPLMGAQEPATLPDLFDFIAATDGGMINDGRGWNGLEFRTGRSLYNQTPALELTFGPDGNVAAAQPVTDDLGIANDFTATGLGFGDAHVERRSGPMNVNDPIDDDEGISRKPGSVEANPVDRDDLVGLATWGLHKGTWPGARYKNVTVDLTKHPELIPAVMALRPGDLLTIDQLDADMVELLILGGSHSIESYHHVVTFNCVPAGPYRVGEVDAAGMRVSSGTSTLAADFDAGTDTSMSVAVTGALWDTSTPPFHIRVGGVVLNVTAISGASSPQTFTVDAAPVNGVERLIAADGPAALTRVNLASPAFVGL